MLQASVFAWAVCSRSFFAAATMFSRLGSTCMHRPAQERTALITVQLAIAYQMQISSVGHVIALIPNIPAV